jgi:hypothetical protein
MTPQDAIRADLERFNAALRKRDAVRTDDDGFQWVDPDRVPADMLDAYRRVSSYAAALGVA